jgi:hypothetical protein
MSSRASASTQRGGYNAMKSFLDARGRASKAAALIIVLAFVVLLTGLALAYFSSTTTDRQLAHSSYNDTSADLLARSALDIVVGDFKQEIVNGSAPTPPPPATPFYVPTSAANVVPQRNIPTPIPNLIRISVNGDPGIAAPAVGSRASAVNSTNNPSANSRSISTTRWNKHCLLPAADLSTATVDNSSPILSFTPPDWVIVTRNGPAVETEIGSGDTALNNPVSTNGNYVIGRYAYAVYDEGGLLEINVAGYPAPGTPLPEYAADVGRKGVITWADLTALLASPTPTPSAPPIGPFSSTFNNFVGFRNYATTQQNGVSDLNFPRFSPAPIDSFLSYFLGAPSGQLKIGLNRDFIAVRNDVFSSDGRTDQSFMTRAELLRFFSNTGFLPRATSVNALQFLGTFSREQNKPTLPLTPSITNGWPSNFTRVVLPRRFYLGNLNLVTDANRYDPNIPSDFGLEWVNTVGGSGACANQLRWKYVGPGTIVLSAIPAFPSNLTTTTPDFFQYINYALFGRTDSDSDHIPFTLGIGAALIDLYDADTLVTGIYYGSPANNSLCDPDIAACIVYGAENGTTVSPTQGGGCMSSVPQAPDNTWAGNFVPFINSPTRTVGEFGWAYSILNAASDPTRNASMHPYYLIDFNEAYTSTSNPDPALLDFFTYNSAPIRAGIVNLNTRQAPVLAAILSQAIYRGTSRTVSQTQALNAANSIVNGGNGLPGTIAQPAMSRADIARFANAVTTCPFVNGCDGTSVNQDVKDTFARAFSEVTQTRTWGLLIDVVAQTGHYPPNADQGPNATNPLANFVVEGEKRYWLHIAIDRFDGTIVGQQLEEVTE